MAIGKVVIEKDDTTKKIAVAEMIVEIVKIAEVTLKTTTGSILTIIIDDVNKKNIKNVLTAAEDAVFVKLLNGKKTEIETIEVLKIAMALSIFAVRVI